MGTSAKRSNIDKRELDRRGVSLSVDGEVEHGRIAEFEILNISASGMLLDCSAQLAVGDTMKLSLPGGKSVGARIVWSNGSFSGCEFDEPISQAILSSVLLKSKPHSAASRESDGGTSDESGNEEFSARLAELRNRRALSHDDIATRLGVSRQAVWYWESGRSKPRPNTLKALAEVLGTREDELLGLSEEKGFPAVVASAKNSIADYLGIDPGEIRIVIER